MKHQKKPLLLVASVFLFVGAIVCMNDILLPSLKSLFHLSYTESTRVQQSFYIVYLFTPIPIAFFIAKWGYKVSLLAALSICSVGCLLFIPAYLISSFLLAMVSLFTVAIGIALINVAANPLAAMLGTPDGSHARVNFVQVFSRIGYAFTPIIGTKLIYASDSGILFYRPYMFIGIGTMLMAVLIYFSSMPSFKPPVDKGFTFRAIMLGAGKYPQLYWGAIAMFFYIGADASTAGFFISYLKEPSIAGFSQDKASDYLSYYYIVTTIFGFLGIYLFRFFSAGKMVVLFGSGMVLMLLLCALSHSSINPLYMVSLGAFISILFPTIFSLGIERLGDFTEKGSALMNIAIVGGAVFPPIQGMVADAAGLQLSYLVPCVCFALIVAYGFFCAHFNAGGSRRNEAHTDPHFM
jgi:FHS family L-fucose permease-like MFS transporter